MVFQLRQLVTLRNALVTSFSTLAAGIVSVLLQAELIPANAGHLAQTGPIATFVACLFFQLLSSRRPGKHPGRTGLLIAGVLVLVSLVLIVLVNACCIVSVPDDSGEMRVEYRYVVGFGRTERFEEDARDLCKGTPSDRMKRCVAGTTRAAMVDNGGPEHIPYWFGWTYWLVLLGYTFSYLTLLATVAWLVNAFAPQKRGGEAGAATNT